MKISLKKGILNIVINGRESIKSAISTRLETVMEEMKQEKKVDIAKQVYLIFGLVLLAFANVFLFDNKEGIGFSVFSTITLLTIGLLSKRPILRILGIVSYLVNVIVAIFGFNYLGWLTGVQAIELIFIVWYLYPKDSFLKTDITDKFTYRFRWQQLLLTGAFSLGIYIVFNIANTLWAGSFLEYGGNTALIFGIQYFLYTFLEKSRANEASFVSKLEESSKMMEEIKANTMFNPLDPAKKRVLPDLATDNFVKMAAIWLVVMDLSILSYIIKPNDIGFGIGAFFVLLSIVVSLFVKTVEKKEDVFSVIYHKIRPIQPVFFIILLIANAHKFSYGAAYALLFAVAYFVWAINKINMKTLLTVTILIYFFPVLGYISNPFRLGAKDVPAAFKMIVDKGQVDYFNFGSWFDFPYNSWDDDYSYPDNLEEEVKYFSEEIILYEDYEVAYSGIWNGDDYDLTISLESDNSIFVEAYGTYQELIIKDLASQYASMKDLDPYDGEKRIDDYYLMGTISSNYGTYSIYLQMDEDWLRAYKADSSSVTYKLYIIGSEVDLKDISGINI